MKEIGRIVFSESVTIGASLPLTELRVLLSGDGDSVIVKGANLGEVEFTSEHSALLWVKSQVGVGVGVEYFVKGMNYEN